MSTKEEETRFLIVGAGVSGLSFADWVKSEDYLICEADSEIGGYCKTVVQDGFVWDYSGHFFHFRHKDLERYLVERMEDQRILEVEKEARIYWKGAHVDFPFQKNIHQLPKEDLIDALYDLYFREDVEAASFKEMLYAKFGRSIAEMFLVPYNEKLYATDLGELDVDAMGRFFPHADLDEIIGNFRQADNTSYNAHFTYPEGGAIQYVRAIEKGVDAEKLWLNERVESIDLQKKQALTSAGRRIRFEHLISSAPLPALLKASRLPHDAEAFSSNKVLVFNLGFDRKGPAGLHWLYVPQREVRFYRVGFYDNIFNTDRMSLYVEIGLQSDAAVDVEAERLRVLRDLEQIGVVQGHELLSWHSIVLDPAYVHISQKGQAEADRCRAKLAEHGVHSIGRYGAWTYCSIEDNMLEARALAERLTT